MVLPNHICECQKYMKVQQRKACASVNAENEKAIIIIIFIKSVENMKNGKSVTWNLE